MNYVYLLFTSSKYLCILNRYFVIDHNSYFKYRNTIQIQKKEGELLNIIELQLKYSKRYSQRDGLL